MAEFDFECEFLDSMTSVVCICVAASTNRDSVILDVYNISTKNLVLTEVCLMSISHLYYSYSEQGVR